MIKIKTMKHITAVLVLVLAGAKALPQAKNFIDQPYISVSGYADTFVTPNEIFIKITLSEKDSRDRVSVEEQETKLINGLNVLGINTTTNLSVFDFGSNYRFYLLKKRDVIKTKQYTLKVADAVTVSKVFMMLEEQDISNAAIDRVNHSDIEQIRNMTRVKAVENAKQKAISMTAILQQTIGPAIHISDEETQEKAGAYAQRRGRLQKSEYEIEKYKYETPKLSFEKIIIEAAVSVQFILK
jgi:uncharacterized protein